LDNRKKVLLAAGAALLTAAPFLRRENNELALSAYTCFSPALPEGFDGCRVLHVSDLHDKEFGPGQKDLLALSRRAEPDYIFMTGDLIHDGRSLLHGLAYMRRAAALAPVYYVPGNHEKRSGRFYELACLLLEAGVHVLYNSAETLTRNGDALSLLGAADPRFYGFEYLDGGVERKFSENLSALCRETENTFRILLSHRPEYLPLYAEKGVDLVFSGHAHGGQVRLPALGGVIAAGQGFFPKYTSGIYTLDGTRMLVSRGLGNSSCKQRLWNRPELLAVTLRRGEG